MARYRKGFEQVVIYLTQEEHMRLQSCKKSTDTGLSTCAARLLLERLNQVKPSTARETTE